MINVNLYNLTPFMLTCSKCESFTSQQPILSQSVIQKKKDKKKTNITDDCLFWILHSILYGNIIKETINPFSVKNDFKIQSAIKLQNDPTILKPYRIVRKYEAIQNLQDKQLNIYGLHALCLLYEINIIYVTQYTYYEILTTDGDIHIIQNNQLLENTDASTIEQIRKSHILITDNKKPLKGLSAYKKDELIEMANKLNISTKGIIKKGIYDSIYELIE